MAPVGEERREIIIMDFYFKERFYCKETQIYNLVARGDSFSCGFIYFLS